MTHLKFGPVRRRTSQPIGSVVGKRSCRAAATALCGLLVFATCLRGADERYHGDSDARYLHHISLYDIDNRKITPESTRPYSSVNTCGRCHDYETISHGWHFNAFQPDSVDGRQGEPWIWTDDKTGTQLPLSYRLWAGTYQPDAVGISDWDMTLKFGDRIPGGKMGSKDAEKEAADVAVEAAAGSASEGPTSAGPVTGESTFSRWQLSGNLEIDCMVCHALSGTYDFSERRRQINQENFAWAPTAAIRLGTIQGRVAIIKDGSDPDDQAIQAKLPTVTYDASRFGQDGSVFMDLIRKPASNACFQCHSNRAVGDHGIEPRWVHDDDVHLRAGMVCADCHRNGIDHHIVRGFPGEANPSGVSVETLSCSGCHLGETDGTDESTTSFARRAGRLGSPMPAHAGLPPLHFEKLSCTACHGGPIPDQQARRTMTSLAHGLGEKGHRSGAELPAIVAPVFAKADDGRVYPSRAVWPAFWGYLENGKVIPVSPNQVYDLTRRALRVRSSFQDEILKPKISSSQLKELLGDERASDPDTWSLEEKAKVDAAQANEGRINFNQKVYAALQAIESERKVETAVYVSSGYVYARSDQEGELKQVDADDPQATSMIRWPMAHNVRPAGWALGSGGCVDCHSEAGTIFTSTVAAVGPGPDQGEPISMAQLQGVDPDQRLDWNELFESRATFKYVVAGSIALLLMTICVGVGAFAARLVGRSA